MQRVPTFENLSMDSPLSESGEKTSKHQKTPPIAIKMRQPLLDIRNVKNNKMARRISDTVGAVVTPKRFNQSPPVRSDPLVIGKEMEKPRRLSTARLHCGRSVFDGFALSILRSGTVVFEKLVTYSDFVVCVREITQISADGGSVTVAKLEQHVAFNATRVLTIDKLVRRGFSAMNMRTYHYDTLPQQIFNRYNCALNFVNILRAKTPKVSVFKIVKGKEVTCNLMESLDDCVVNFGVGDKAKLSVSYSSDLSIRIQAGEITLTVNSKDECQQLPLQLQDMLKTANTLRQMALRIEETVTKSDQVGIQFPIECGKRKMAI